MPHITKNRMVFTEGTSQDQFVWNEALGLAEVDLHAAKMRSAANFFFVHVESIALAFVELQGCNFLLNEVVDRLKDRRNEVGIGARRFIGEDLGDLPTCHR